MGLKASEYCKQREITNYDRHRSESNTRPNNIFIGCLGIRRLPKDKKS